MVVFNKVFIVFLGAHVQLPMLAVTALLSPVASLIMTMTATSWTLTAAILLTGLPATMRTGLWKTYQAYFLDVIIMGVALLSGMMAIKLVNTQIS